MKEEWQTDHAASLIKLSRFLLNKADSRGLTHGEKHYLIQTSLALLLEAYNSVAPATKQDYRTEVDKVDPSDIPF